MYLLIISLIKFMSWTPSIFKKLFNLEKLVSNNLNINFKFSLFFSKQFNSKMKIKLKYSCV